MALRRSRGIVRPQRQRSATNWARTLISGPVTVAAGAKVLLASLVLSTAGINEVVRRTRGQILITADNVTTGNWLVGAFGLIVVNDLALAAGVASIPGPVTDRSDDGWFVWEPVMQLSQATDGVSSGIGNSGAVPFMFDSKAMRRVAEGFGIAIVFENGSVADQIEVGFVLSLLSSRT